MDERLSTLTTIMERVKAHVTDLINQNSALISKNEQLEAMVAAQQDTIIEKEKELNDMKMSIHVAFDHSPEKTAEELRHNVFEDTIEWIINQKWGGYSKIPSIANRNKGK